MPILLQKGKNWHDSYFRKVIQYHIVARQFLSWLAPKDITENIDFGSIKMLNTSYIDKNLNETFSDVVLDCRFKDSTEGRIIILIEHQSKPQRFLPVRIHHYMHNVLIKLLKEHDNDQSNKSLPAVYPIIYYNGKNPYPYSTKLQDCLGGPERAKMYFCNEDIQIIDVNQLTLKAIKQHHLAGVVANAMKRSTIAQTPENYRTVLSQLGIEQNNSEIPEGFTRSTIEYMMNVKSVDNINELIKQSEQLSKQIKGEVMTIAELFEQRGKKQGELIGKKQGRIIGEKQGRIIGEAQGQTKVAINLLKKGMPVDEVAAVTELDLAVIQELYNQLSDQLH